MPLFHLFVLNMTLKLKLWRMILTLHLVQGLKQPDICDQVSIVSNELFLLKLHRCADPIILASVKKVVRVPGLTLLAIGSAFLLMYLLCVVS